MSNREPKALVLPGYNPPVLARTVPSPPPAAPPAYQVPLPQGFQTMLPEARWEQVQGNVADAQAEVNYRMAQEEYRLRLALMETQAKLQKLQRAKSANIQVSEKGAVSVYGLGKYPVTLYADQWRMLLAQAELIEQFIQEHQDDLAERHG